MTEGQAGILASACATIAVAAALWRQGVLGPLPLAVAVAATLALATFLYLGL